MGEGIAPTRRGCTHSMHSRILETIDPCIPTKPGRIPSRSLETIDLLIPTQPGRMVQAEQFYLEFSIHKSKYFEVAIYFHKT